MNELKAPGRLYKLRVLAIQWLAKGCSFIFNSTSFNHYPAYMYITIKNPKTVFYSMTKLLHHFIFHLVICY